MSSAMDRTLNRPGVDNCPATTAGVSSIERDFSEPPHRANTLHGNVTVASANVGTLRFIAKWPAVCSIASETSPARVGTTVLIHRSGPRFGRTLNEVPLSGLTPATYCPSNVSGQPPQPWFDR